MQKAISLSAQKRTAGRVQARHLRDQGVVPGTVYGHIDAPITIAVDHSAILKAYRTAGQSALVELDVEGGKNLKVLIQALEVHPVRGDIQHVDFYAVDLDSKTTVPVPFVFVGESDAIKTLGGMFMTSHNDIDIRCLPTEIPHEIEVDISKLKDFTDSIHVSDLVLDREKYEIMSLNEDEVICSVSEAKMQEVEEEAPEDDMGEEGEEGEEGEKGEGGAEGGKEKAEEGDKKEA